MSKKIIGPFNLNSFEDKSNCCGCAACESICPVESISMVEDAEGFLYPLVDTKTCITCGLCEKVCPIIHNKKNPQKEFVQACYSKDEKIRKNASSGGIFELLARDIIAEGGVVFGAAFDENLTLKHMQADNIKDLRKLTKSKYIQSDINGSFLKVKEILLSNKKVLFVGAPCQVSALITFLGKPYVNLLTVDFICHGVPSNKMFKSYKESVEKKTDGKMIEFNFRVKNDSIKHIHGYSYIIKKDDEIKLKRGMFFDNPFYLGFKKYLFLRPSCYSCKYATPDRVSDITLADFWGIEEYLPELDFSKGVSMVLVNSEKGAASFMKLDRDIDKHQFKMDIAIRSNQCLSAPTKVPINREIIMQDYQTLTFNEFSKKHIKSNKYILYKLYYFLPMFIRKYIIKKFRGIGYV